MITKKDTAVSFLSLITSGRIREAYEKHVAPEFQHHNPFFRGDAKSLMAGMEDNGKRFPIKTLTVHRVLEDGDLVAVHSQVKLRPGKTEFAVVHIMRFQEDRIVELWDLGQPVPENSPNEFGMF